jgi:hypothetical protein
MSLHIHVPTRKGTSANFKGICAKQNCVSIGLILKYFTGSSKLKHSSYDPSHLLLPSKTPDSILAEESITEKKIYLKDAVVYFS